MAGTAPSLVDDGYCGMSRIWFIGLCSTTAIVNNYWAVMVNEVTNDKTRRGRSERTGWWSGHGRIPEVHEVDGSQEWMLSRTTGLPGW